MSPASIQANRLRTARAANSLHGVNVTFRGQEVRVVLSAVTISLDLALGGMAQGGAFRCRFLAETLTAPPQVHETLLYHGRTYIIREVAEPVQHTGEHLVIISPGSKQ